MEKIKFRYIFICLILNSIRYFLLSFIKRVINGVNEPFRYL